MRRGGILVRDLQESRRSCAPVPSADGTADQQREDFPFHPVAWFVLEGFEQRLLGE